MDDCAQPTVDIENAYPNGKRRPWVDRARFPVVDANVLQFAIGSNKDQSSQLFNRSPTGDRQPACNVMLLIVDPTIAALTMTVYAVS